MDIIKNRYFIRTDENKRIIKTFSSVFEKSEKNDILIGEGEGSQFRAGKEVLSEELQEFSDIENGLELLNEHGLYCLKYENGVINKVSDVELQEEFNALPKPQIVNLEILEEENVTLMEAVADLYESMLLKDKQIKGLKKEKNISEIYAKLITINKKNIDDVPTHLNVEVEKILNNL